MCHYRVYAGSGKTGCLKRHSCELRGSRSDLDTVADMRRAAAGNIPEFGKKVPLKRAGQPVELAPVYVFLASGESSYVTAEVYGVTGGLHLM